MQFRSNKKPVVVKAIIVSSKGNILIVNPNTNHPWQFPGGKLEANENPIEGLVREIKEETNLDIDKKHLEIQDVVHRIDSDVIILVYIYSIKVDESIPIVLQANELQEYRYEHVGKLSELMGNHYNSLLKTNLL